MPFIIANFRHVVNGLQEGQFAKPSPISDRSVWPLLSLTRNFVDKFSMKMVFECGQVQSSRDFDLLSARGSRILAVFWLAAPPALQVFCREEALAR